MSRLIREIAIAGALLLAVTSCSTTTAETTTPTPSPQEYIECLREQGFDVPDFDSSESSQEPGDSEDYDPEAVKAAVAECGGPIDHPGFTLSPEEETEWTDSQLAFAQCMRANGIDYPDPADAGSSEVIIDDYEKFNAATDTCEESAYGDLEGFEVIDGDVIYTPDDS